MATSFCLLMVSAAACGLGADARPQYDNFNTISYISGSDAQATIIEEENQPNGGLGNYVYRYTTSNGISQNEEGIFEPGTEPETGDMEVAGSYSYVDPSGITRTVTYTAGVDGFRAQGDHLPTPVPTQYPLPQVPARDGGGGGGGGAALGGQGFGAGR
ncbi:flexible cuticle protein 12-like [Pollicipes pollicipes]|uniref:flexible cuticle protein 12-like n=1 Tax=Pollicipes pollicipes TaxID=41117 RepID=UPI001885139B|nr:flexible cuticle protein 12-like [Pollicipes pollicipes]XP_037094816.1 flexible cuticle protein 12-like [Pollicipes pollicipes]